MKKNIGLGDQLFRILSGIILIMIYFFVSPSNPWNYVLLIGAAILIITGLTGRCLLYKIFGINTWLFRPADEK